MKKYLIILAFLITGIIGMIYLSTSSTKKSTDTCDLANGQSMEDIDFGKYKKVRVAASSLYESDGLKEIVQGKNFRDSWATPVTVPVVFLDTLHGGLEIVKEGGGKQTQSLRLKDKQGILYTLRSVNKDPEPLIPEFLKFLGLENIVVDGISAQHPYAAPVVARLSESAGILHTAPKTFFIPHQEVLDTLNEKYGNRLYHFEFESKGEVNWTNLDSVQAILDTEDLQELKMEVGPRLHIDKNTLVRSRLFDLLIGDWDRHAKQWGWVIQKSDSSLLAIPLPVDRDNAFFSIDGIIPSIVSNKHIQPKVRPFEKEIDFLDGLIYDFDIYFLQHVSEDVFLQEARHLQMSLPDSTLRKAFSIWNNELYEQHGDELINKISERRDNLPSLAIKFKALLDEKPLLSEPLKGSERKDVNASLLQCFDCLDKEE